MRKNNYIIIDFETGGVDETVYQATQVCCFSVNFDDLSILSKYDSFIKPYANLEIDKDILAKTMVRMEDILNGKEAKKVVSDLIEFFKSANPNGRPQSKPYLVGHNVDFDVRFLVHLFKVNGKNVWDYVDGCRIDTLALAQEHWSDLPEGEATSFKLGVCCERIGYQLDNAHNAESDVLATYNLFKYFREILRNKNSTLSFEAKEQVNRVGYEF